MRRVQYNIKNPPRWVIEESYPLRRGSLELGTSPVMAWRPYRASPVFSSNREAKVWYVRHMDSDFLRAPESLCVDQFNRISRNWKHVRVGRVT